MRDIAIQFSGGKDSLAVLHLMRPMLDDCTVYFGDPGGLYPHMVEFVHRTCEEMRVPLRVVIPPIPLVEYHAKAGLPSDIVPIDATADMQAAMRASGRLSLQSNIACCSAMLWNPMQAAIVADGIKMVVRGSKGGDQRVGVPDGFVDGHGIKYLSPLWDWSDDEVFEYLRRRGVALAAHYADINASFDCMGCTGFLNDRGSREKLEWTHAHYPAQWPAIAQRIRAVRNCIDEERARLAPVFAIADELKERAYA